MSDADALLRAAEEVVSILRHHRVDAVVIGAVALAVFNYVRYTEDVDLGVDADLPTLRAVPAALRRAGYEVALREPDAADPPGGPRRADRRVGRHLPINAGYRKGRV